MLRRTPVLVVVVAVLTVGGCSQSGDPAVEESTVATVVTSSTAAATATTTTTTTTTARKTVLQMWRDATEKIELVSPKQLAEQIESGDVLLVDVRQPSEIQRSGTIAGSVQVPRGILEWQADPASPFFKHDGVFGDFDRRTVTFCEGGGNGAFTAVALQELGYRNVATLEGGFSDWVSAGLPTVAESESDAESDPARVAIEIVDKWNAAWVVNDVEAAAALFTEDGVYVMEGEHQGPAIYQYIQRESRGLTFAERLDSATQTDAGTFVVPTRVIWHGVTYLTDLEVELDGDLVSRIDHVTWIEADQ